MGAPALNGKYEAAIFNLTDLKIQRRIFLSIHFITP